MLHARPRQRGFTLIELLLAMVLFALLAVGSARVLDVVMRAERARQAQAEQLHALGRAMSLIQRDALQGYLPASLAKGGYGILLNGDRAHWLTREPDHQALKRSELRVVEYWLADGVLWRQRRTQGQGQPRPQRLLEGVGELQWRLYVPGSGWQAHWPMAQRRALPPQALEVTLSTRRLAQIRRVLTLGGASQ
ncbi:type II secretion system minor pseudopilin GspJ [Pseudomonas sp. p99-361]|uniref:type II secretion system minor pseudopilin GspJ n=1 Tax=Pseudomonas sp. p99-361 TaxID=2479852 RepID=UPI000F7A6BB6|nr:type II secretion system minor pseudopilin GspJ [Pseudomonas sp. p99-361]RRV77746.1 type II secretion system protein GspJ [Pseudomonas sp. p99-361]